MKQRQHEISRRSFLAAPALLQPARKRPNILLFLADNWAYPHAGAYGDGVLRTPTFDRLANQGVVFRNAFASNPSCSPSRSSLLSGQASHRLGEAASLYGNLSRDIPLYTELLEQAGYFVGFEGKGWGPGNFKLAGRTKNPSGVPFESFEEFLRAKPADRPFCFWFGSHDPHVPWDRGRERKSALNAAKIRIPAYVPDDPAVRDDILNYYCEVQQFDADCGAMIDTLEKRGELDNTLVAMTSDNGWQIPRGLANCYDSGVHIPLALRMPGRIAAGKSREDFVDIADLAPTFLETAGLSIPRQMTAKSLFTPDNRDAVFPERERHANVRKGDLSYPIRGIRTSQYLYLRNIEPDRWPAGDPEFYWAVGPYGDIDDSQTKQLLMSKRPAPYFDICFGKRPAEELYDVRNDPDEVRNLAADPKYATTKRDLARRLETWMKETADPRAKGPTDFWDRVPYTGPRKKGA
jgi:arylsulfatase A-like enzyme